MTLDFIRAYKLSGVPVPTAMSSPTQALGGDPFIAFNGEVFDYTASMA